MRLHSISCHCVLFNGIKWYWMVLHGSYNVMVQIMSWYCKVLHFLARHPIVLHGIVWYWIVLHWIDRYLIVLNDIAWCCVLLNSIALYWLVNLVLHCMLLNAILLYSNYSENTNVTFQDALQSRFLGFRLKDFFLNKIFCIFYLACPVPTALRRYLKSHSVEQNKLFQCKHRE